MGGVNFSGHTGMYEFTRIEPYTCHLCEKKYWLLEHDNYCRQCWKDMKTAKEIFGDDKHSPLDYMITSGGSVRVVPDHCERCGKKFRFYRKENTVFDKSEHYFHHWKHVCIDCINLETDSY